MSTRIAAALTLDTQGFQAGISKAEADANKFSARLRANKVGFFGGKSAQQSGSAIQEIMAAQDRLASFRKQQSFNEANTVGKIKTVTSELRDLAVQRSKAEAGTTASFALQLQHEQKIAQLRSLQRAQQSLNIGGDFDGESGPNKKGGLFGALGKQFNKRFGWLGVAKGVFAGLAIGKIHDITEGIAGAITGGSMEGYEKLTEYAEKEKGLIQKRVEMYLNAGKRVEAIEKRITEVRSDMTPRKVAKYSLLNPITGKRHELGGETDQEYNLRMRPFQEELGQLEIQKIAAQAGLREHQRQIENIKRQREAVGETENGKINRLHAEIVDDVKTSIDPKVTGPEQDAAALRADTKLLEIKQTEYDLVRDYIKSSEQISEIERTRAALNESGAEKVARLRNEAFELEKKSRDVQVRGPERNAAAAAAAGKRLDAAQAEISVLVQEAAIEDRLRDLREGTAALGETTEERILRLKQDAARLDERSRDMLRTDAQRKEDILESAEKTAAAAKLEHEWLNKPLTVEAAAARSKSGRRNTTTIGVLARRVQEFAGKAEERRRLGDFVGAENYDEKGRIAQKAFSDYESAHRKAARLGKPVLDAQPVVPGSWDARYGASLSARNAAINQGIDERQRRLGVPATARSTFVDPTKMDERNLFTARNEGKLDKAMSQDPTAQAMKWALEHAKTLQKQPVKS